MNKKELRKLEKRLLTVNITLESIKNDLSKYLNTSNDFLETESIDKKRRYGISEFKRAFLQDPGGRVSSFMKTFTYIKNMEAILTNNYRVLYGEKLRLERMLSSHV
jgi:hypothetical protein